MSKELPYFRFTASEWLNGDISLEATYMKGIFIDICSYYWFKNCSLTKAMLKKKYSSDVDGINDLIKLEILKHNKKTDFLEIGFLNEQFDMLSESRKRRQLAGSKGGKSKTSNAKAKPKQSPSYKDKDKDKDKDKIIKTDWDLLFDTWFDYKIKKGQTYKDDNSKKLFAKKLNKLSNGNIETAREIIEESMSNNWAGIFEIKNQNNGTNQKQGASLEGIRDMLNETCSDLPNRD